MSVPKVILKTHLDKGVIVWLELVRVLFKLDAIKSLPDHSEDGIRKYVARTLYGKMKV